MDLNQKVVFVGGGNMAQALLWGLARANLGLSLGVIDTDQDKLDDFAKMGIATALSATDDSATLLDSADVVVLAVKPQVLAEVCAPIQSILRQKLVISIAAGVTLDRLQTMTATSRIVRTMPNLGATVGLGATGLFANKHHLLEGDDRLAECIMGASGVCVWVNTEDDLHTVTAVAGSAPAYFFYMLEAMTDKACELGLSREQALQLATQTMEGAAVMVANGGNWQNPSQLRAKVTSKGGTTHAAIVALQEHNFAQTIGDAMSACVARSVELGA